MNDPTRDDTINPPDVVSEILPASGSIPNNPRLPLLLYRGAVTLRGADPAAIFERLFSANHWPAAWRNGVFPFHHYHSNAHEALGVYSGEVDVLFGGPDGVTLTAGPGDVVVLPSGTGHKRVSARGSLGIVGAYPAGQDPDMCQAVVGSAERHRERVAATPAPIADPVYGETGPLMALWAS